MGRTFLGFEFERKTNVASTTNNRPRTFGIERTLALEIVKIFAEFSSNRNIFPLKFSVYSTFRWTIPVSWSRRKNFSTFLRRSAPIRPDETSPGIFTDKIIRNFSKCKTFLEFKKKKNCFPCFSSRFGTNNRIFNQLINSIAQSFENEFYFEQVRMISRENTFRQKNQNFSRCKNSFWNTEVRHRPRNKLWIKF